MLSLKNFQRNKSSNSFKVSRLNINAKLSSHLQNQKRKESEFSVTPKKKNLQINES